MRETTEIVPARTETARVAALGVADGEGFATRPVERLALDLEGIVPGDDGAAGLAGDRHRGAVRRADARAPWYPRGRPIRNARQLSVVAPDELAAVAADLGLPALPPEWLGANLVLEGVAGLSLLPRGTRILGPGGAGLAVEDQNAPCRKAGHAIARHHPGRPGLAAAFVAVARRRRGLVAWVEHPGTLAVGDTVRLRIPEQWVWRG